MNLDMLKDQTLGQYELRELLGVGGMGAVYRGYQASLEREVAIKVIFSRWAGSDEYQERFIREARMAASLEHAHIVPVYDFGTENGMSYVVMRLLGGGSLAERIIHNQNNGLLPLPEVARITTDLASALHYAHRRGIIHRDIKASNVMFDDQNTVFLVDFGIAKLASSTSQRLTDSGVKIGTPEFMAPEQWLNESLTPAVDQYSLAILVYLMLTGKIPFKGEQAYQFMHSHLYESPTPLVQWRSDLPASLMPILDRAMNKDPKERYRDVEAFAQAFNTAVSAHLGRGTVILPGNQIVETIILPAAPDEQQPAPEPRTRRLRLAVALALIAVLIGVVALLASDRNDGDTVSAADDHSTGAALAAASSDTPTEAPTHTATATDRPARTPTSTEAPSPTVPAVTFAGEPATITLPLMSMLAGERGVIAAEIKCALWECQVVEIVIQFNPDVLQIEQIEAGPFFGGSAVTRSNLIDNAAGIIRLAAETSSKPDESAEPVLMRLNIQARSPGASQLRITQLEVASADGEPQYVIGVDGGVIVAGAASTEAPTCQYRVQAGDTLSGIALANGVTVDQINELNEIPNRSMIRVGQVLTIPASDCRAPAPASYANRNSSDIIEVHDCRHLGGGVFEWYSVRRDYDASGSPVSEIRIGGPYSGAWRPGCPGAPSSGGSGSSGSSGSSSGGSTSGSSGGSDSETSGGQPDDDDDGGLICLLGLLC